MRFWVLTVCLLAVFALGLGNEGLAMERADRDGEKSITAHGHHGGWGRRGGRGWRDGRGYGPNYGGGCYYY